LSSRSRLRRAASSWAAACDDIEPADTRHVPIDREIRQAIERTGQEFASRPLLLRLELEGTEQCLQRAGIRLVVINDVNPPVFVALRIGSGSTGARSAIRIIAIGIFRGYGRSSFACRSAPAESKYACPRGPRLFSHRPQRRTNQLLTRCASTQ
jgi:hypothetical protein